MNSFQTFKLVEKNREIFDFFKHLENTNKNIEFSLTTQHGVQFHLFKDEYEVVNGIDTGCDCLYVTFYLPYHVYKDAYSIQNNQYIRKGMSAKSVIYGPKTIDDMKNDIAEFIKGESRVHNLLKAEKEECDKIYEATKYIKDKNKQTQVIQKMLNINAEFEEDQSENLEKMPWM